MLLHHPPHRGGARARCADWMTPARSRTSSLLAAACNGCCTATTTGRACIICRVRGVPVGGVPSASAKPGTHQPGAVDRLFSISRDGERLVIKGRARGVDNAGGELVDLGALDL